MAAKTTPVRMLTAMAGDFFAYAHGEIITVETEVADAWKSAGIAEEPPKALAAEKAAREAGARVDELEQLLADMTGERDELKSQAEQLGAQVADLSAKLAAATPAA